MTACNPKQKADLIISNATVYTVDEKFSTVEAFAVADGKILATGTTTDILNRFTASQVIDASELFIYPGFNDAHCHFNGYATNLVRYANLKGTKNEDEVYAILKEHHFKYGGDWLLGRGWDQNNWPEKSFPDNKKLNEYFPDIPVYLIRIDGHAAWCNDIALKKAGIEAATQVRGGMVLIEKDRPTGILIDNAMDLVRSIIPEMPEETQIKGLLQAQKNCFAAGLTSLTDAGLEKKTIHLIQNMHNNKSLKIRINAMLNPSHENFTHFVEKGPYYSERLTINTIKLYADGALGSRGALLFEDYNDAKGNQGLQIESKKYYENICSLAYANNFIVATHAIGDSANRLILLTYAQYLKEKNDRRWRIEHAQVVHPDDFMLFAKYNIIPSIQATHATSDMGWAEERLGTQRAKGAYAYQSLMKQNAWLPNGTDFPIEGIEPIATFYASVFRTNHQGLPEGGWHINEGLTREQALRSITFWPAKAAFEETKKGSIEAGKFADFVILDTDLMQANSKDILKSRIISTWINGEKVFDSKKD